MAIIGNADLVAAIVVIVCISLGFIFALFNAYQTANITIHSGVSLEDVRSFSFSFSSSFLPSLPPLVASFLHPVLVADFFFFSPPSLACSPSRRA